MLLSEEQLDLIKSVYIRKQYKIIMDVVGKDHAALARLSGIVADETKDFIEMLKQNEMVREAIKQIREEGATKTQPAPKKKEAVAKKAKIKNNKKK